MDYLKPVLGTSGSVNPNLIIPGGIVRERCKMFIQNHHQWQTNFREQHHPEGFTTWTPSNKNKNYPIVNTRTPRRPPMVYVNDSSFRRREMPEFVITIRPRSSLPSNCSTNDSATNIPTIKSTAVWNDMNFSKMSLTSSRRASDDQSSTMSGSSEIMSMHDQIVRFSATSSEPTSTLANKEASLVVRLEQELTQAQICNHRLNQQLKVLANSSDKAIKVELATTKKQLKERVNEVDQLKKHLGKFNTERAMWLSKQPHDVNALLAEKQELRKQLDREQNEKQELFIQINSMIAKLADSGDQDEINRLKSDVNSLKKELEAEKIASNAEAARLKSELQRAKSEVESSIKDGDKEKESMEQEIENLQRQLNIKTASLQSLMLAKSDSSKTDKLTEENESLKQKVQDLQSQVTKLMKEIGEKSTEISEMKDAISVSDVSRQNADSLGEKLAEISQSLKEEQTQKTQLLTQTETLKSALSSSEDTLSKLKSRLAEFEESATLLKNENEQLKQNQREATMFDSGRIKELTQVLNDERDNNAILNVQLREKDGKIDRIQVELLASESRAKQAEEDVKELRDRILKSEKSDDSNNQQLQLLKDELVKVQKNLETAENTIKSKETEIEDFRRQLELQKEEKTRTDEAKRKAESQVAQLESELESQRKRIQELADDRKILESKASVASEIGTLMASLNSVREENAQYEEEIRGLQNNIREMREEGYQLQDKCDQWKMRAEKAEMDVESANQRLTELLGEHQNEMEKIENEKKTLEKRVDEAEDEARKAAREASDSITQAKREFTESSINSERQIQTLNEKVESLTRELDSSKRRMEQLQEDQCKFIGSHDEIKETMMKDLQSAQDDVEKFSVEIGKLKSRNEHLEQTLQESELLEKDLKKQLETAEKKIEDTKDQLHAAEDLADRLQEAQILSGNVESKFSDLQRDSKASMEKLLDDHRVEVEKLKEELKKSHTEQMSLESVLEEQQKESEHLQSQLREEKDLEERLKKQTADAKVLDEKLSDLVKTNDLLVLDVQKLSSSLESKTKKLEEVEAEFQQLKTSSTNGKSEIDEIQAENARLAGELLKLHSSSEKSLQEERDRISKQFEERLKAATLEKTSLASELQVAESKQKTLGNQIEDLQNQLESAERRRRADIQQLEYVREELHQVKNDNEKLKSSTPVAPPRSSTRTISNMSAMTNFTQADFSECEDLTRLRAEIDKQKRLIIVLRRKLQGLQQ